MGGHFLGAGWMKKVGERRCPAAEPPHLPFSHLLSFQAPESSEGQREIIPLMALSLLQLLIAAPAVPRFIPKAGTGAGMFIYYSPK